MTNTDGPVVVVDLITAEDTGNLCDTCSDPIDRGQLVAVLSNGDRVHDDSCGRAAEELQIPGRWCRAWERQTPAGMHPA